MKIFNLTLVAFLFQTLNLSADVKFNFIYADRPGHGFHARPEAKAALEEIAHTLGSDWLKYHHAEIIIQVISTHTNSDICENTFYINHLKEHGQGFHPSNIQYKILNGETFQSRKFDDVLPIDFSCNYSFTDPVNEDQIDFKALILHKMTQLLGFHSSIPHNKLTLRQSINNFIKKAFYYCSNEFNDEKNVISEELIKDIHLFQSMNLDFDNYILDQASSAFELIHAEFIIAFKNDIINKIPFNYAQYPFYYSRVIDCLNAIDVDMESFIALNYSEPENLISQMLQFGLNKLSGQDSSTLDESKIKKNFLIFHSLNQENDNYGRHLEDFIARVHLPEVELECLEKVIQFSSQYLLKGEMNEKELSQFKKEIAEILSSSSKTLEELIKLYSRKQLECSFNTFDEFIVNQNGEGMINVEGCTNSTHYASLFFKGPKVLQYLGELIPLQKNNPNYISKEETSLMNPFNKKGPQLRNWDKGTTAILLDLGYKIDNSWTQTWALNN